jgi:hypothetical protein
MGPRSQGKSELAWRGGGDGGGGAPPGKGGGYDPYGAGPSGFDRDQSSNFGRNAANNHHSSPYDDRPSNHHGNGAGGDHGGDHGEDYGGDDDEDEDDPPMTRLQKLLVFGLWLGSLAFTIWYIVIEARTYSKAGITTKVSIFNKDNVEFPGITLCNFEANVSLTVRNNSCSVVSATTREPCTIQQRKDLGDYDCYTYNWDPANVYTSTNIGLRGMIEARLIINRANYTGGLYGVQAVLHEVSKQPDINLKTFFVPPGRSTLVALRRLETVPIKPVVAGERALSWEFEMQYAAVANTVDKDDTVLVSFLYKELSVQEITEVYAYPTLDFLGVISGMIGTMLGFDVFGLSILFTRTTFRIARERKLPPISLPT